MQTGTADKENEMAKPFKVPIVIDGIDFTIRILKNLENNFELQDNVSDEFKKGFWEGFKSCKQMTIMMLENMKNECS